MCEGTMAWGKTKAARRSCSHGVYKESRQTGGYCCLSLWTIIHNHHYKCLDNPMLYI